VKRSLLESVMNSEEISAIESRLGYIFLDRGLLIQALTRKAAALEQRQKGKICEDQEVFRTLGDAVLKVILTELLIQQGYTTRGSITQKKAQLENEESLSKMLRTMGIIPIVGIGESRNGVHEQSLALAETFEAIIAAIYKDGGYEIVKKLVVRWFNLLI
jgi:ribonuclease III